MKKTQAPPPIINVLCSLLLLVSGNVTLWGQPGSPPPGQSLAPHQLDGCAVREDLGINAAGTGTPDDRFNADRS